MEEKNIPRPSGCLLPERDAALIQEHARTSDVARMLAPAVQGLLHERGWLCTLAPRAAGGLELELPKVVRLEESIAAVDGSVGWTVTLCAGAGWFAGFLPPDLAQEILGTKAVCIAGSGAPTGFAEVEGSGYRISGSWQFATGAPFATHFTMNAVLREGGRPVLDHAGKQIVRAFIVPARHVSIHDTWRSTGLRATASHSFSIDHVWVDADHGFDIDAAKATAPGPLYRFPFASLAYVTIAANISGMALHFLSLAEAIVSQRKHPMTEQPLIKHPEVHATLAQAHRDIESRRSVFYELLDRMWSMVQLGKVPVLPDMHDLHAASLQLVKSARSAVDELYPYCGIHAAHEESEINRVWRDVHSGTQHTILLPLAG